GKFVTQPREEKKSFQQRDEKKGKSDRKCFRCGDPNHLIGDCPKPPRNKDQKAFIGGSWSDSKNDAEDKTNNETSLMAQSSNEVHGSSTPGSVDLSGAEKVAEHIFSPPLSSRLDFVITRKKLIHNRIDELKKPSLKLSLKSALGSLKDIPSSKELKIKYLYTLGSMKQEKLESQAGNRQCAPHLPYVRRTSLQSQKN
ncbi:zf-CCHC domain-containing protein, partial [Tanacetum coccineum]